MDQTSWIRMVQEARVSDVGFEKLLDVLKPRLRGLAFTICSARYQDDAVQMATIKIWKSLGKINTHNGTNIESYLLKISINAMCSWVMQNKRKTMVQEVLETDGSGKEMMEISCKQLLLLSVDHCGILTHYLEYIRQTGTFRGAHKAIAKVLGVSPRKTQHDFSVAAEDFRYRLQAS